MIVGQSVQAVAKTVFVLQSSDKHGIDDPTVEREAHAPYPSIVVLRIMHDFIGGALKYFL